MPSGYRVFLALCAIEVALTTTNNGFAAESPVAKSPHRVFFATSANRIVEFDSKQPPSAWAAGFAVGYAYRATQHLELGMQIGYLRAQEKSPDLFFPALTLRGALPLDVRGDAELGVSLRLGPTVQTMHQTDDSSHWRRNVFAATTVAPDLRFKLTERLSFQIAPEVTLGIPVDFMSHEDENFEAPWKVFGAYGLSAGIVGVL
jgi:hypothetical protein